MAFETKRYRHGTASAAALAVLMAVGTAVPVAAFKDSDPASGACGALSPASAAWTACVGAASAQRSDAELFYAGYWLARSGRYAEALDFLTKAKAPDERVLTYIGFALRKLGRTDEAMGFYNDALARNPNYSVARAYMGEGFLAKDEPDKAREQLVEIERRSGRASAEYADLSGHIARFEAQQRRPG